MARLADDITVTLAGEAITLRPSLRFAIRLERRPGSFAGLLREIDEGRLSTAVEIIRVHTGMRDLEGHVFDGLDALRQPLTLYILACTGLDPDDRPGKAKGSSVPFRDHLASLYRIGTGWLGWTPADTLDATPAEINEAHKGRIDMLKAIFGGSEQQQPKPSNLSLDEKIRTAFGSFGTTIVHRKKAA